MRLTRIFLILCSLFLLGFYVRIHNLGALGFSEDECFKIEAVKHYAAGDFTANAEHPMISKILIFISEKAANWWNDYITSKKIGSISEEAALRFPNALIGALTVFPIFLLSSTFFGRKIGVLTAAFWATGIGAVSFNRIGKEDTLMVFFTLFSYYFYRRAKMIGDGDAKTRDKFYLMSGVMFGLQLASKYIMGYLTLIVLFYHFLGQKHQNQPISPRTKAIFFGSMLLTFLAADPVVLLPSTWHYISQYLSEKLVQHHGYQFMGHLYSNNLHNTPFGSPAYFYVLYFLIKMPLPLVVLSLIGFVHAFVVRRGAARPFLRFMVIWLLIPLSFVGGKWLRYGFAFLPYYYMAAALGFALLWRLPVIKHWRSSVPYLPTVIACLLVLFNCVNVFENLPTPLLYVNALGGGTSSAGKLFTPEEFNDAGFREMYAYLATHADKGSIVATDEAAIFAHYSGEWRRNDLHQIPIRSSLIESGTKECYVIVHEGNRFYENDDVLQYLKKQRTPEATFKIGQMTVARLYKVQARDLTGTLVASITGNRNVSTFPQ